MRWTSADIPDQTGRTVVVTGANSGLGLETARALAAHGAGVVLACRTTAKGEQAAASMTGDVSVRRLDLADLSSVREFADGTGEIDVLINNAGVMAVPKGRTADGFEMQIGTNFLGHFALTGLLLPKIRERVVSLASVAHWAGRIDTDDLNWERRRYQRWLAYSQSKLADLMFSAELGRRLSASGSSVVSTAAHPGYSATELGTHTENYLQRVISLGNRLIAQGAEAGSWPTLYAATMPDVVSGSYYGPGGPGEIAGHPKRAARSRRARDERTAGRLWTLGEQLTKVSYL